MYRLVREYLINIQNVMLMLFIAALAVFVYMGYVLVKPEKF